MRINVDRSGAIFPIEMKQRNGQAKCIRQLRRMGWGREWGWEPDSGNSISDPGHAVYSRQLKPGAKPRTDFHNWTAFKRTQCLTAGVMSDCLAPQRN